MAEIEPREQTLPTAEHVEKAAERIRPYLPPTPLKAHRSDGATAPALYLKLENRQPTGAFKVRGAFNRLLSLRDSERESGVIAASTGNHGAAVAHAGAALGVPVTVFMPESVSARKLARLQNYGVEIILVEGDALSSEIRARQTAAESNWVYVSPYNDPWIIAGQGSAAVEMMDQCPDLKTIFVAVGGGGLIAGIGLYLKARFPHVQLIGCQPQNSPVMSASVAAGRVVELEEGETLSDGTAGGLEADAITFDICRRLVDEWRLVSEAEIRHAIRWMHEQTGETIEGAAGVALAAGLEHQGGDSDDKSGVVICGGNIDEAMLQSVLGGA